MSDKRRDDGGEPSMEEILASIRKIISEDTEGQSGGGQDSGGKGGQTARQDAGQSAEADADVLDLAEAAEPTDADADEPLELGEPADDDASLDSAPDNADDDALDLTEAVDETETAAEDSDPEMPEAQAADPLADAPDSEADSGADPGADSDDDPFADLAGADPSSDDDDDMPAATAPEPAGQTQESAEMGTDANRQSTVSQQTEDAAVGQLTELARAANAAEGGSDRPKSDADRILENMVREALRPQLQAWLDQNLPTLVERIVREEVRRMTRRAETIAEDEQAES